MQRNWNSAKYKEPEKNLDTTKNFGILVIQIDPLLNVICEMFKVQIYKKLIWWFGHPYPKT